MKNMIFGFREEAVLVFPIEAGLIQALEIVYCCFEKFPSLSDVKMGLSSFLVRNLFA